MNKNMELEAQLSKAQQERSDAQAALEFKTRTAEDQILEIARLNHDLSLKNGVQATLDTVAAEKAKVDDALREQTHKNTELEAQLSKAQQEGSDVQAALEFKTRTAEDQTLEIARLNHDLSLKNGVQATLDTVAAEKAKVDDALREQTHKNTELEAQLSKTQQESLDIQAALEFKTRTAEDQTLEIARLNHDLSLKNGVQATLDTVAAEKAKVDDALCEQTHKNTELEAQLSKTQQESLDIQAALEFKTRTAEDQTLEIARLNHDLSLKNGVQATLDTEKAKIDDALREQTHKNTELEAQLSKAQQEGSDVQVELHTKSCASDE
ncbi:hypothetical protein DXG01_010897, partial [Tephrocybe rancida]